MANRNPNRKCQVCSAPFYCPPSRVAQGYGKFCSKTCMGAAKSGRPQGDLFINPHKFLKGSAPWNKDNGRIGSSCGYCHRPLWVLLSQGTRFCSKKCTYLAARIPDNELDPVKNYGIIHGRIRERYGTPSECEHCGTKVSSKFEWANISGLYRLERSDWARLCCTCHRRFDLGVNKRIEVLQCA